MTREEAIEILKQFKKCLSDVVFDKKGSEAWQMAIQALSQEPCDDAISREAVLSLFDKSTFASWDLTLLEHRIKALPPVTQKSGKWIDKEISNPNYPFQDRKIIECSKCHYGIVQARLGYTNFCPNCGAKMVEPQGRSGKE